MAVGIYLFAAIVIMGTLFRLCPVVLSRAHTCGLGTSIWDNNTLSSARWKTLFLSRLINEKLASVLKLGLKFGSGIYLGLGLDESSDLDRDLILAFEDFKVMSSIKLHYLASYFFS